MEKTILDKEAIAQLTAFRQQLHQKPEISEKEKETAATIVKAVKACNPSQLHTSVGGHGVVAVFDSGSEGPTILFRADMDALPIQETNTFSYISKNKGVMHACGHDGHSTMLLGLAQAIAKTPPVCGKAVLLFQPAEEIGAGAEKVMQDPKFNAISPDWVFGLHNLPGFPLHEIIVKEQTFTASVTSISISLEGKTAHAGEPENGINPALAVAEILFQASQWSNNRPEQENFAVVTPIQVELGNEAYGTSAGSAIVRFTLRTWSQTQMQTLQQKMETFLQQVAEKHQLVLNYHYIQGFQATSNHPEATGAVRHAAKKRKLSIREQELPFKWGEDFGLFTQQFNGAFFGLGAGSNTPALHNPDYDFPDEILPTGIVMFFELYKHYLLCP